MKTRKTLVFAVAVTCAIASPAWAQASRTWVSGVGDDANPCSRTAPCKTFAGAISKTAANGIINALDPGGFGAVTITKSITIDGGSMLSSVLAASTNAIVISTVGASDVVTLRNLDIEGVGSGLTGILVNGTVGAVHVENCTISSFTQRGIDFRPAAGVLYVSGGRIQDVTLAGVLVAGQHANVERLVIEGATVGLKATGGAFLTVRDSVVTGSSFTGVISEAASVVDITNSSITGNATGIGAATGGMLAVGGSTIAANSVIGLSNDGTGSLVSTGTNKLLNNSNGVFTAMMPLR